MANVCLGYLERSRSAHRWTVGRRRRARKDDVIVLGTGTLTNCAYFEGKLTLGTRREGRPYPSGRRAILQRHGVRCSHVWTWEA